MEVTLLIYYLLKCSDRHFNGSVRSWTPLMLRKAKSKTDPGRDLVRKFPQFSQVSVFSVRRTQDASSGKVHHRKYGVVGFVCYAQLRIMRLCSLYIHRIIFLCLVGDTTRYTVYIVPFPAYILYSVCVRYFSGRKRNTRNKGAIPGCPITCLVGCHLSYYSSGTNLITFVYHNKNSRWVSIIHCNNSWKARRTFITTRRLAAISMLSPFYSKLHQYVVPQQRNRGILARSQDPSLGKKSVWSIEWNKVPIMMIIPQSMTVSLPIHVLKCDMTANEVF